MKGLRIGFIVFAAAVFTFGLSGMAFAFHSGGAAECMGCHAIHDGQSLSGLLTASDPSSTCTNDCHGNQTPGSYHIMSLNTGTGGVNNGVVPMQLTPGGDFGWLLKDFSWSPRSGTTENEAGASHGHNVVAADRAGMVVDPVNATAPGGDMNSALLGCTSCHDNHGTLRRLSTEAYAMTGAPIIGSGSYTSSTAPAAGQAVGAYRLLRGTGSAAGAGGKTFSAVFNAVVASSYNRSEATTSTAIAYGAGVSDWCATCHPDMHSATSTKLTHPTNQGFSSTVATIYNAYLGSGLTGASGFDPIVPFQSDNLGPEALKPYAVASTTPTAALAQAQTSSRVMCLSCHRSHASGFPFMLRWNGTGGEFIAVDGVWPGTDSPSTIATAAKYAMGRTVAVMSAAYNNVPETKYATYQRALCNKCHAKD